MSRRLREWAAIPWVAAAAVALVARLPSFGEPLALDVSIYALTGFAWTEGATPFGDVFDMKGPLVPELFALLDVVLPTSAAWLRLFLLVTFVASLWQLSQLVARHAGRAAAWTATVAYAIAASSLAFEGQDPNTEQLALPLMIAAIDLGDRARVAQRSSLAAAAGLALGLACGFKPPYGLLAIPLVLVLGRDARRLGAAAIGVAGGVLLVLLPLVLAGGLDEFIDVSETRADYTGNDWERVFDGGVRGAMQYFTAFPGDALLGAALVGAVLAWRVPRLRGALLVTLAWVAVMWINARLTGNSFAHYFIPMVPPLAILVGLGVAAVPDAARTPVAAIALAALAGALLLTPIRAQLAMPPEERFGTYHVPALARVDEAAESVERLTQPGERIFVVTGGPQNAGQAIYWLARRLPAARHTFADSLNPPPWEEVAADLRRTPPAAVVVMPGAPTEQLSEALDGYAVVDTIGGPAGNTLVLAP